MLVLIVYRKPLIITTLLFVGFCEMLDSSESLSWRERIHTVYRATLYRPTLTVGIILFSAFATAFEGIGLTFLLPIIELAQNPESAQNASGYMELFVSGFEFIGIPFTLGYVVLAVAAVFVVRYTSSFLVYWLKGFLGADYECYLKKQAYDKALGAKVNFPTYNRKDHLPGAIEGILDQTYDRIELIVADDDSPTPARETVDDISFDSPNSVTFTRHDEETQGVLRDSRSGRA